MKYTISKNALIRDIGDKTFVFDVDSDDVIVRFGGDLAKFPEFLKSERTLDELKSYLKADDGQVNKLVKELSDLGFVAGSSRSNKDFVPFTLSVGGSSVEFITFEQLLPEGSNSAVYASYCACNCCGYCDNCGSGSDC